MLGSCRTDPSAFVRRGRRKVQSALCQYRLHHRMRRAAQRDRRQASGHSRRNLRPFAQRQNKRQCPGPERLRQLPRQRSKLRQFLGSGQIRHMDDQRIEVRPPLRRIYMRHGVRIAGIGGKAIDRLGGNRHDLPTSQKVGSRRNRSIIGGHNPAIPQGI